LFSTEGTAASLEILSYSSGLWLFGPIVLYLHQNSQRFVLLCQQYLSAFKVHVSVFLSTLQLGGLYPLPGKLRKKWSETYCTWQMFSEIMTLLPFHAHFTSSLTSKTDGHQKNQVPVMEPLCVTNEKNGVCSLLNMNTFYTHSIYGCLARKLWTGIKMRKCL